VHVRWLELRAFRNHASLGFAPDRSVNVLTGSNAQGKTSLLEALHVVVAGRSFRTAQLGECVSWGASEAVVGAELRHGTQSWPVRVRVFARGGLAIEPGLCPWARAVSFAASDLGLLSGSPQARRGYLDGAAAKLVPAHGEACRRYRLVLHQRARLLAQVSSRADATRVLEPWDAQVAGLGSEIVHRRLDVLAVLGGVAQEVWRALAPAGRGLALEYVSDVAPGADQAETRERLRAALGAARRAELARGVTLVGPHRDEIAVRLGGTDARRFASRGEQRVAVLSLRLAEAGAVARRLGVAPVLVLDDVLTELDGGARRRVLEWLERQGQVVFSTTDEASLPRAAGTIWSVRPSGVEATRGVVEPIAAEGVA